MNNKCTYVYVCIQSSVCTAAVKVVRTLGLVALSCSENLGFSLADHRVSVIVSKKATDVHIE